YFLFRATNPCSPGVLLLNLGLLQAWVPCPEVFFSLNLVSWSVSVEFGFYALFLLLIPGWRTTWWWKLPLALLPACAAVWYCNAFGLATQPMRPGAVSAVGLLYIFPLSRLFEFTLGMALALLWKHLGPRLRHG